MQVHRAHATPVAASLIPFHHDDIFFMLLAGCAPAVAECGLCATPSPARHSAILPSSSSHFQPCWPAEGCSRRRPAGPSPPLLAQHPDAPHPRYLPWPCPTAESRTGTCPPPTFRITSSYPCRPCPPPWKPAPSPSGTSRRAMPSRRAIPLQRLKRIRRRWHSR